MTENPIRVMALLPESKSSEKITGSSLIDDELPEYAKRGVELHTMVHADAGKNSPLLKKHTYPSFKSFHRIARGVTDLAIQSHRRFLRDASRKHSIRLAQMQREIARVVERNKISVIHSNWARPSGTAAALAKKITGRPLVMTLRGADVFLEDSIGYGSMNDPWYALRLKNAFSSADKIIGVSSQIINRAIDLGADPLKTTVIKKGVKEKDFTPGDQTIARQKLGLPDQPTILFVGALGAWKGIEDLLNAFLLVKKQKPNARLVFCGSGDLRNSIESFIQKHCLHSDIDLMGYLSREKLPDYFRACDVFTLPSLTEGSGNVILEAASCGKPAVGTRVGGIPDYISDGTTGLLCGKRNPEDLADKLLKLLLNNDMKERFGFEARKEVLQHYRYDQMIDHTIDVYHDVLNQ